MSRISKSRLVLVLVLAVLLTASMQLWAAELVILHTNDVHSRLESHIPADAEQEQGGRVRLATLVDDIRKLYGKEKVLLLDAGDSTHGTNVDNLFGGVASIRVMNQMGYSAFVLGNHDFNYGQEVLAERIRDAKFPVLVANVTREDGSPLTGASAVIQEVNGIKVGIIGLVSEETPISTHPKNVVGLVFHDPISTAKILVERIRPKVDVLIALTHIGYDKDVELAMAVPELDVIVGGHSHTVLWSVEDVNGVIIAQTGEYANNLGFIVLDVEDGQIVKYNGFLIPVTADIPKNPKIQAEVDYWNDQVQKRLDAVIGRTSVTWDGERASVRTSETNLGNLVADIMRAATGSDIAVTNGGGIRASINPGEVKIQDIYTVLPFDNSLVVVEMLGMDIIEALEHSVRLLPDQNGGFLQVSGITFEVDPKAEPGGRVLNVKVNGERIVASKKYTVATNDFLAAGGDGYETFLNASVVAETGIMLKDVMVEYIQEQPQLEEPQGGRIVILQ